MSAPLLSIIIPTKNRQKYLNSCLDSITLIESSEIEVVICDNSDKDELRNAISSRNDPRLKYHYDPQWMSVSENFNNGFIRARGKYVTMIGDDDGVSRYILDLVKWMEKQDVEVSLPKFAVYYWPDMQFKYHGDRFSGELTIPRHESKSRDLYVDQQLEDCLKLGGTTLGLLPQVYYGIVSKKLLDEVYRKCRAYVPGASPDMAVAASLACVANTVVEIDLPLFVAGNSAGSGAGMGAQKKHKGDIENIPWLPKDTAQKWTLYIPKFWSGPTIWSESCAEALRSMGKAEKLDRFNYLYLYARCLVFNPEYRVRILEAFNNYCRDFRANKAFAAIAIAGYYVAIWTDRLRTFVKNRLKNHEMGKLAAHEKVFRPISDVYTACEKLNEEIGEDVRRFLKSDRIKKDV